MTHLKIEQNNTTIEQVSGAVIEKLYQLAFSGDLDASSNLVGRLHTTATYQEYVNFLTQQFQNLYISADRYYIYFNDSEVQRILTNAIGDGVGVTEQAAGEVTTFSNMFNGNTDITSFDELYKFGNIILSQDDFTNCTNLVSVNLPVNCQFTGTTNGKGTFKGCTSLSSIGNNISTISEFGWFTFQGCTSLGIGEVLELNLKASGDNYGAFQQTGYEAVIVHCSGDPYIGAIFRQMPNVKKIDFSDCGITYITNDYFQYSSVKTVIFPSSTGNRQIEWNFITDSPQLEKIILLSTTVPPIESTDFFRLNRTWCFYVPDEALSAYQQADKWNTFTDRIKPLSSSDLDNVTWYTKSNLNT